MLPLRRPYEPPWNSASKPWNVNPFFICRLSAPPSALRPKTGLFDCTSARSTALLGMKSKFTVWANAAAGQSSTAIASMPPKKPERIPRLPPTRRFPVLHRQSSVERSGRHVSGHSVNSTGHFWQCAASGRGRRQLHGEADEVGQVL